MFSAATKTGSQPSVAVNYIEDVFSTYLYTGNGDSGATQTVNNGIDLAGKGGMLWLKDRSSAQSNWISDTVRGNTKMLYTNRTDAQQTIIDNPGGLSFSSNGFSLVGNPFTGFSNSNQTGENYASWTFRKQPKFFDVVTYTGDGNSRTISHNLGSVPGMIIVKRTDAAADWYVYHRSTTSSNFLRLNTTIAATAASIWDNTDPTSSVFSVSGSNTVNGNGFTYVAYLFAHNAGGFGTSGTDNAISCGSVTADAGGAATVNLGFEPQFVMYKSATSAENWYMSDVMRGMYAPTTMGNVLYPSLSNAEAATTRCPFINATGMSWDGNYNYLAPNQTYIYMAIRRPMKVPTDATTVFKPVKQNSINATPTTVSTGFPVDLLITADPSRTYNGNNWDIDRLRGTSTSAFPGLLTNDTTSELALSGSGFGFDNNTGMVDSFWGTRYGASTPIIYWSFSRRPGFFDEVCYTGTGSARTITHNLGVTPEFMLVKDRSSSSYNWIAYSAPTGATSGFWFNTTNAVLTGFTAWNSTAPTSSVFSVSSAVAVNASGDNYVAYLFATCPGVSKVGSYTGNGGTQAISCGFTGGARFVLIKRTDSTGGWYVYDTARGMTTLVDPYLLLNSTAAESATLGSVTTTAGGFTVNASILAAINTSGASYIFLAIA